MTHDLHAFRLQLLAGIRRYRPACSCGWTGRRRILSESARHQWLEHLPFRSVCHGE